MRGLLRSLRTKPWTRAPLLLLASPGVVLAVAGAVLVLVAAAAATPLFLSSVATEAQSRQIAERCQWDSGVSLQTFGNPDSLAGLVDRSTVGLPHRGEVVGTVVSVGMEVTRQPGQVSEFNSRMMERTRAGDHVDIIAGGAGGLLIPDTIATGLGVTAGDSIAVGYLDTSVAVPVGGVYTDLATGAGGELDSWWCSEGRYINPPGAFTEAVPPPLMLVDRPTYHALETVLALPRPAEITVEYSIDPDGLDYSDGGVIVDGFARLQEVINADGTGQRVHSELSFMHARAGAIQTAVRRGITPVAVAGFMTALLLVIAAGAYWVERRRTEVLMLGARGVGPGELAVKAGLEMAPAAVVGGVIGWGLAVLGVKLVGPTDILEPSALRLSLVLAAFATVAGVLLLGGVAGLRSRAETEAVRGRRAHPLARLPWELGALALAAVSLHRLRVQQPASVEGATIPKVDVFGLAFPLLLLAGALALAVRIGRIVLLRVRRRSGRFPDAAYLAVCRLSGNRRATLALVAAAGLSVAVLIYAATLTTSLRETLDAKSQIAVGTDISFGLIGGEQPIAESMVDRTTIVVTEDGADIGEIQGKVLGVDPDTFERAAFWQSRFSNASLGDLLDRLGPAGDDGTVPAILVGSGLGEDPVLVAADVDARDVPLRVVATVEAFPGMATAAPTVVVDRQALADANVRAEFHAWVRGDPDEATAAFRAAGTKIRFAERADRFLQATSYLTVGWTFGFLQSVGAIAGALTVGGVLLYLDARQRGRHLAYAITKRMGLSRRQHRRSLYVEVAAMLVGGALIGAALAALAAVLSYTRLDPLPSQPPVPFLAVPSLSLTILALLVLGTVALAAGLAQRAADRADTMEVLRLGS